MSQIAARTLELLNLLQSQREWTGKDLAERLEVSTRTVRRDVERLRELGYPLEADKGPGGVYRLSPGKDLPPLVCDDEQAIAIALALQMPQSSLPDLLDPIKRAFQTVSHLLPPDVGRRLKTFNIQSIDNAWELAPPAVSSVALATLSAAAQERQLIRFSYRSVDSVADDFVLAEPNRLVVWSGRWYLIAYAQHANSWHSYRLDRIKNITLPGWRFRAREFPFTDVGSFIKLHPDRGDTHDSWPCQGTVTMNCPVDIVAQWAPGTANIESLDERTTRITMGAWSWAGLLGLIATFDCDFTIDGPAELAQAAAEVASRLDKASTSSNLENRHA
ncbi:MAG: helix-turn-helix transcriptional regulator [Angustibacter sp.]